MKKRYILKPLLVLMALAPNVWADNSISLSRTLVANEAFQQPTTVTVYWYDAADATQPVLVQPLEADQWQTDWDLSTAAGNVQLQVKIKDSQSLDLTAPLWAEITADGNLLGVRAPLRAAAVPNISVFGEIESRDGGFRFPNDSLQTSAIAATCAAGSSIRSLSPDGAFACETDDTGVGTVTSVVAGSGLSGGTITGSGTISVASGGITNAHLASGAVTSSKLANDAVTAAIIATNAVETSAVLDGNITTAKIATNAINADKIDSTQVQKRVSGSCALGEIISAINEDGSVACSAAATTTYYTQPNYNLIVDDASNSGGYSSMAIGADGLPVISYQGGSTMLKVTKCNDPACSGDDETISTVDASGWVYYTSIAIGSDGMPVISYQHGGNKLMVAKCNDPACTGGDETLTVVDAVGDVGENSEIAIGSDGMPVIAYRDTDNESLKFAKCHDMACSTAAVTTLDNSGNMGRYNIGIAIGNDGFPVISYLDFDGFDLKVVKCDDLTCSGGGETLSIASTDSSLYSDITIGSDGLPVISHYRNSSQQMQVTHCNDIACSGGDESTVIIDDGSGNYVGWNTSIAIGSDGFPIITYEDYTESTVKIAKCNDVACAGGDEIIRTLTSSSTAVHARPSIAVDANGLPVISYMDKILNVLRVIKCGSPSCG